MTKKRNEAKSKFRKLVTKWRRFKIEKSENKIKLFKNLKFGQYDKIKTQMKKEEGNNSEIDPNDFSMDEEISRVVEYAKKHGKTAEDLFEWNERPREWEKLEIIYEAHTKNKAYHKAYNTEKKHKRGWILLG